MYEFKTTPFQHQRRALQAMRGREFFALLMEMGTGKTKVAIDDIGILLSEDEIDLAIVFAPKGVYKNWVRREIPAHMPSDLLSGIVLGVWESGGGSSENKKTLEKLLHTRGILVINIEAVSSGDKAMRYIDLLMKNRRVAVYIDESTKIKNHSSNRSKNVMKIGRGAKYRRIMTGSPVTRSPLDLFSQFEFLSPGSLGSRSFYAFRARYAVMQQKTFGGRSVDIVVGYRNLDELTDRVSHHSFRVLKEECLDLPAKVYETVDVDLTDEQRRVYNEVRDEAFSVLENGEIVSATAIITQILRLQQVVCGHVTDADGVVRTLRSGRVEAMMDVLEEISGKVVIWARFRHDIRCIAEALRETYGDDSVAEFHGGNTATREDEADRFISDPSCRFMVSNQQSGGYGNTWIAANTVIYYSNDYDLEKRLQSEDRTHRAGQTKSVTYIDLVARGTVDEKILHALRKKIDIAAVVLGEGPRAWLV